MQSRLLRDTLFHKKGQVALDGYWSDKYNYDFDFDDGTMFEKVDSNSE